MRDTLLAAGIGLLLVTGCGTAESTDGARAELAPTGSIRAALNFANPVLATRAAPGGQPGGVASELAREIGRRLGVPIAFLPFDSAAAMADAAGTGAWDMAFLGADPAREGTITLTPAYLELDATYLVPAGSRFRALGEIDASGVRIAARPRSAYDLFLRRSLTRATLVYPEGTETDLDVLSKGRSDVMAGLKHVLVDTAAKTPGAYRIIDGRFAAMQQAIGVTRGRAAAAAWLDAFVEDVKASGLVARAIAATGAEGVSVAPPRRSDAAPK
jgi:polar amino acid transport system substrate-binding protein